VLVEGFVFRAAFVDEFLVGKSFAHDDVSHGEEEGDIGSNADGKVKMCELGKTRLARIGDNEFSSFCEGFFEAGGGDGVALGHVGADGEDGIGLVHVLERIGHCASSDWSGQTGHCGSVSGSTTVVYMMRAKARSNKLLHGIGCSVRSAATCDAVNTMPAVLGSGVSKAFRGCFESGVPVDFLEGAVGLFEERLLQAVFVLNEVVGELAFDAESSFVGWAVHGGLRADDLVALCHQVDRAADGAVGADGAGLLDLLGEFLGAERFFIGESSGGAGLDALATEGAVGVAKVVVELGRDLGVEATVGDGDSVVAFLLRADADAAVAGDALFVVAEDEGVRILEVGGSGFGPFEATVASAVSIDESGEFLGRETA